MILFITVILVVFCLVGVWLILTVEDNHRKNKRVEVDDINPSKWGSIEPGPDSLYPLQKGDEDVEINERK
ncbi:hypothetical protein DRO38_08365 [Candidatus Bathyarchaeota archaeon]|nr:MAG: hypothetical protein DRO38_08365 [Candidatus Bathyarchaeota archaeon]HDH87154.1 hypothetical protein [Desulfobacteraceae bacterium]